MEIALHLPPLEVQLEVLTVKFMCKCLTAGDFMTAIILQAEGSLHKYFYKQLNAIKQYLSWRTKGPHERKTTRLIELTDIKRWDQTVYTKELVSRYETVLWMKKLLNKASIQRHHSPIDIVVEGIATKVLTSEMAFSKENFIFNHNTSKDEDSFIMDYIHGNSSIFGKRQLEDASPNTSNCHFCGKFWKDNTPGHQLFRCSKVMDKTQSNLNNTIKSEENYLEEVLTADEKKVHTCFIKRVQYLMMQHCAPVVHSSV